MCSVFQESECHHSEGLCKWDHHKCAMESTSCFKVGKHHVSTMWAIGLFSLVSLILFGGCACCICRIRRRRLNRNQLPTVNYKREQKKEIEKLPAEVPLEEVSSMSIQQGFIYTPMQQLGGGMPQPFAFHTKDGIAFPVVQFPVAPIHNDEA